MSENKVDKATVERLLNVFDVTLSAIIEAGLGFCSVKSDDYRSGYLAGTELVNRTVLETLRKLAEEVE